MCPVSLLYSKFLSVQIQQKVKIDAELFSPCIVIAAGG